MDLTKIIWEAFKPYWWILLLIILGYLVMEFISALINRRQDDKKYSTIEEIHSDRNLLNSLRNLKPSDFENYIAYLFNKLGFSTELVGGSYDGGVDVIAVKDNIKYYIQCKKFITSQVSVGDVRNFYGALVDHLANGKGYFITTNKFTLEAERFAEDKPIELIDGYRLIEYIRLSKSENDIIPTKKEESKKCPQCGGNLIEKIGKYGKFFGCSNYPKCRFTKKL
ncbi:MAG: restriction endonuclease [Patescibacteria group bacterium]|jgi:restriction system protein